LNSKSDEVQAECGAISLKPSSKRSLANASAKSSGAKNNKGNFDMTEGKDFNPSFKGAHAKKKKE
jgi:hypothetical protein